MTDLEKALNTPLISPRPATDKELAKQRENFNVGPRGPRDTYAIRDGEESGLNHLRDDVRRVEELGLWRKNLGKKPEIRGLGANSIIVDYVDESKAE